jgi:hypothetical protein
MLLSRKLITPSTAMPGTKKEWLNLPSRKCSNCGCTYKPKRPVKAGQRYSFCKRKCKDQFHAAGGAFVQLRDKIAPAVQKQFDLQAAELCREIVRQELVQWAEPMQRQFNASAADLVRKIVREELNSWNARVAS